MKKLKYTMGIMMAMMVFGIATQLVSAQTATPVPSGEAFEVTNANGYRTYNMPDIGTVEYPLAFYSVWNGVPGGTSRDGEIFFPGVITLRPNDSVIYGVQFDTAYQIRIAMSEATGDLDASMLGSGPLFQYEPGLINSADVQEFSLNGVPALRVDNVPTGMYGEITTHIVAVVDARMVEIIVEPIGEVGGNAITGTDILNQILGSIKLESYA